MRKLLALASVGLLVAAFGLVPLPLVELSPGPALDVTSRVHVGHATGRIQGRLLLTDVLLSDPSSSQALAAWMSSDHQLLRTQAVLPPGVDQQQYFRAEQQVFAESGRVGAAVAERAAGDHIDVTSQGVQVAAVVPGSPAAGHLQTGDMIEAVDGQPVQVASSVVAATSGKPAGTKISLRVQRAGRTVAVHLALGHVSGIARPALGIAVQTLGLHIHLPVPVTVDTQGIGGPSAGLMMALTTYALITPGDLTHGRTIAGTGTIDLSGRVGPIGGIREKVVGAERAGATIFLAPASQAATARAQANPTLEVVPVKTFADALHVLESLP